SSRPAPIYRSRLTANSPSAIRITRCCLLGTTQPRSARRKPVLLLPVDVGSFTCPRLPSFHDSRMNSVIPWAFPLAQYRAHQAPIQSAIDRVLNSGTYILGAEVEAFENAFADYCGGGHGVGVAS